MKVIIAGGRNFTQYQLLKFKCDAILKNVDKTDLQIVSGGAKGADELGERYARDRHILVKRFEADWDRDGKAAGPIRNRKMAEYADCLIAFWNGFGRGTKNMIDVATELGLKVRIIKYR